MSLKTGFDELWRSDDDDESEAPATARGGNRADDDVWDSDGSEHGGDRPASSSIAARDGNSIRAKHYKEGYKDSVAHARETSLQLGFGEGFSRGFELGLRQGRFLGLCSTAKELNAGDGTGQSDGELSALASETRALRDRLAEEDARIEATMASLVRRAQEAIQQPCLRVLLTTAEIRETKQC